MGHNFRQFETFSGLGCIPDPGATPQSVLIRLSLFIKADPLKTCLLAHAGWFAGFQTFFS
jgi:hypothetical protein